MNIVKKLRLDEEYIFAGQMHDLERFLLSFKEPKVERIGRQEYRLTPSSSVGTLVISGVSHQATGINVTASVTVVDKDYQQIKFTTTPRVEHFFIGLIFLIFIVVVTIQGESFWFYPILLGLWAIAHLWFHVICRSQEEEVVDKIVRHLRLIDKSRFQMSLS